MIIWQLPPYHPMAPMASFYGGFLWRSRAAANLYTCMYAATMCVLLKFCGVVHLVFSEKGLGEGVNLLWSCPCAPEELLTCTSYILEGRLDSGRSVQ